MACHRCGNTTCQVGDGKGPHLASLRCGHGHFVKWIGRGELAQWTALTSTGQAPAVSCDIQHYGYHSGYYASLTFACSGIFITETFWDYLRGMDVQWRLCQGHAEHLLICHDCRSKRISPYSAVHQCASCASAER